MTFGQKYKLSEESQQKIKVEKVWNEVPKANETFCLDIYKHSDAPLIAAKKGDLFSGLNQTVKVRGHFTLCHYLNIHLKNSNKKIHNFTEHRF